MKQKAGGGGGKIKGKPHLALGYTESILPSFATCPTEITDIKLVHGSCRRVNHELEDGLSWLDDLILDARSDPLDRPHQLLMSGDQIYADGVALPMLPQLLERGIELMGPHEFLPMRWQESSADPLGVVFRPVNKVCLPAGMRHRLMDTEARFTTKDKHSHIISFGEFCAMYLFVWSNVLWDSETRHDFDEDVIKNALELLFNEIGEDMLRNVR